MQGAAFAFAPELTGRLLPLSKGAWLFRRGQLCKELFTVRSGVVRLVRPQSDGTTAVMQVASAGEWIAESSLFIERYHCHAIAESDAMIAAVNKADFLRLLQKDPQRALLLSQLFATRLRDARALQEILRKRKADDRVLSWLQERATGRPPALKLDRTWTSIADELALSREALYRAVAALKGAGEIKISGKRIELRDLT